MLILLNFKLENLIINFYLFQNVEKIKVVSQSIMKSDEYFHINWYKS